MRMRIVLFLLSSIIAFGCAKKADDHDMKPPPQGQNCPDCVTVHEIVLDGQCPDVVRLKSQDVVKFSNPTGRKVSIFGLDNKGSRVSHPPGNNPLGVRLSRKKMINLWPDDSVGYLQVNRNPYSDSLSFDYSVWYTGPGAEHCGAPPDSVIMRRMSMQAPPSMIVGPDTL